MKPISPDLKYSSIDVVEDQMECDDAKSMAYARFRLPDGQRVLCSRWRLSEAERDRLILGADVYLYEVGQMRDLVITAGPMSEAEVIGPPPSAPPN
jgi:hypothetical protein